MRVNDDSPSLFETLLNFAKSHRGTWKKLNFEFRCAAKFDDHLDNTIVERGFKAGSRRFVDAVANAHKILSQAQLCGDIRQRIT